MLGARPSFWSRCAEAAVGSISIDGGREGLDPDEPNPSVAAWTASTAQRGTITIDLADPDPAWAGPGSVALADDQLYVVSAESSDEDGEATPASFRGRDLAALDPDQVVVRDGAVVSRTAYDDEACD